METIKQALLLCICTLSFMFNQGSLSAQDKKENEPPIDKVTIAILAKDKGHTLPLYLSCIEKQTWPSHKSYLYIRTNNNNDDTAKILREWIEKVGDKYAGVFFDDSDVKEAIQKYKQHEWNAERFKVLGKIRQDSIDFAKKNHSHYFVADCDNFIRPNTIEQLMKTNLPIVAPFLKIADTKTYSNYHAAVDQNGYLADTPDYYAFFSRSIKGLIDVPVVHCSYFIQHDTLDKISYDDQSARYEYVIFSDNARKQQIPQYLDNREIYGRISFAENKEEFEKEPWLFEFLSPQEQISFAFTSIYQNALWGTNKENKGSSGSGSTAENTLIYRDYLKEFMKTNQIKSVVDIGCGDWEFSQLVDWTAINYIGYDIVKSVIENNSRIYSKPTIQFIHENFLDVDLPKADLLICKDVFQHLSNEEIIAFLPQLKKFKHCLITNDVNPNNNSSDNHNIPIGGYRPLDLTIPPFNLSPESTFYFISGRVKKVVLHIKEP